MELATPVRRYFEADRAGDEAALADTFHPAAVVRDEGRTHTGREAIRAWWREAEVRTPHVLEPMEIGSGGDPVTVRARVSGAFAGSPVVLSFAFRLDGDRISALEITP